MFYLVATWFDAQDNMHHIRHTQAVVEDDMALFPVLEALLPAEYHALEGSIEAWPVEEAEDIDAIS